MFLNVLSILVFSQLLYAEEYVFQIPSTSSNSTQDEMLFCNSSRGAQYHPNDDSVVCFPPGSVIHLDIFKRVNLSFGCRPSFVCDRVDVIITCKDGGSISSPSSNVPVYFDALTYNTSLTIQNCNVFGTLLVNTNISNGVNITVTDSTVYGHEDGGTSESGFFHLVDPSESLLAAPLMSSVQFYRVAFRDLRVISDVLGCVNFGLPLKKQGTFTCFLDEHPPSKIRVVMENVSVTNCNTTSGQAYVFSCGVNVSSTTSITVQRVYPATMSGGGAICVRYYSVLRAARIVLRDVGFVGAGYSCGVSVHNHANVVIRSIEAERVQSSGFGSIVGTYDSSRPTIESIVATDISMSRHDLGIFYVSMISKLSIGVVTFRNVSGCIIIVLSSASLQIMSMDVQGVRSAGAGVLYVEHNAKVDISTIRITTVSALLSVFSTNTNGIARMGDVYVSGVNLTCGTKVLSVTIENCGIAQAQHNSGIIIQTLTAQSITSTGSVRGAILSAENDCNIRIEALLHVDNVTVRDGSGGIASAIGQSNIFIFRGVFRDVSLLKGNGGVVYAAENAKVTMSSFVATNVSLLEGRGGIASIHDSASFSCCQFGGHVTQITGIPAGIECSSSAPLQLYNVTFSQDIAPTMIGTNQNAAIFNAQHPCNTIYLQNVSILHKSYSVNTYGCFLYDSLNMMSDLNVRIMDSVWSGCRSCNGSSSNAVTLNLHNGINDGGLIAVENVILPRDGCQVLKTTTTNTTANTSQTIMIPTSCKLVSTPICTPLHDMSVNTIGDPSVSTLRTARMMTHVVEMTSFVGAEPDTVFTSQLALTMANFHCHNILSADDDGGGGTWISFGKLASEDAFGLPKHISESLWIVITVCCIYVAHALFSVFYGAMKKDKSKAFGSTRSYFNHGVQQSKFPHHSTRFHLAVQLPVVALAATNNVEYAFPRIVIAVVVIIPLAVLHYVSVTRRQGATYKPKKQKENQASGGNATTCNVIQYYGMPLGTWSPWQSVNIGGIFFHTYRGDVYPHVWSWVLILMGCATTVVSLQRSLSTDFACDTAHMIAASAYILYGCIVLYVRPMCVRLLSLIRGVRLILLGSVGILSVFSDHGDDNNDGQHVSPRVVEVIVVLAFMETIVGFIAKGLEPMDMSEFTENQEGVTSKRKNSEQNQQIKECETDVLMKPFMLPPMPPTLEQVHKEERPQAGALRTNVQSAKKSFSPSMLL
eukprot:PhF_6_TR36337/c0_g1_i1/m.53242